MGPACFITCRLGCNRSSKENLKIFHILKVWQRCCKGCVCDYHSTNISPLTVQYISVRKVEISATVYKQLRKALKIPNAVTCWTLLGFAEKHFAMFVWKNSRKEKRSWKLNKEVSENVFIILWKQIVVQKSFQE